MIGAGSYILSALELAALVLALGFSAVRLRGRLLPGWSGAPARLVESIAAIAFLIWMVEVLGTFSLFYGWAVVASSVVLAVAVAWRTGSAPSLPGGGIERGDKPEEQLHRRAGGPRSATGPTGPGSHVPAAIPPLALLIAVGVVALVFAHWGLTAKDALDRGIFNFDSLWYHLPFAVDMVQSHSVTGLHYTDTVFTNWFYPQNSELLHAVGIAVTHRDTLSLFINFGWLAIAFLAAWCIGRPYGRGHLTVVAAALVLESHLLVVREPGAAKNDLAAATPLLVAIAILVNAWAAQRAEAGDGERVALSPGWPLAVAGLSVGLAAGTKVTVLAMAAALSVAVIALSPGGRRRAAAAWWFIPAFLGGGYWYLRNLVAAGNPIPQIAHLGPISLPHPLRVQTARPDFSIVHYATDTGVWREFFAPGLHHAFGFLWPLVVVAAIAGAAIAVLRGRDPILRWAGGVALFGILAYLFTPLSASGAEGEPLAFAINLRYLLPAMLTGLVLLPLAPFFSSSHRQWWLLAALVVVLLITDRSDAALRDPARFFGLLVAAVAVLVPAALLTARRRGASSGAVVAGFAILALAVVAIGYPVQRHYLHERFRNDPAKVAAGEAIPGMNLDSTYAWLRDKSDLRIGVAGTSAGFAQYGFYGTDLSNHVIYLGEKGPHGAFNAIPTCSAFRTAVNGAHIEYLVVAPFLNFLHPSKPIASPEEAWMNETGNAEPVLREGSVTLWKIFRHLPTACGPVNAPLRDIPNAPGA
jgi:hypothetical protein